MKIIEPNASRVVYLCAVALYLQAIFLTVRFFPG